MDAAWARGIRAFDTADAYGGGRSETWIGLWMAARGRRPALTTKVFHSVVGDPDDRGLSADRIRRQIDGSLERLGVERVDVYLIHEPDPETPIAETLGALAELVEAGKVGAIGASNVDRAWLEEGLSVAPISVVQNSFSLLDREAEDVVAYCAEREIDFHAFGPLAGGWLTGKYRRGEPPPPGSRMTQRPEGYATKSSTGSSAWRPGGTCPRSPLHGCSRTPTWPPSSPDRDGPSTSSPRSPRATCGSPAMSAIN
jgi:aryl-alcohol dehydrogenase-like predicted oxidoreductase